MPSADRTVMVFAPVPQLTVTIEQQSDEAELHVHPGGQGVWQARMCAGLGAGVTLCAAVGGEIGDAQWRRIAYESASSFALLESRRNSISSLFKMDMCSSLYQTEW